VLVLGDAYYPGWRAFVGSQETEVFPANYAFRGITLPPGDHRVEFRYQPDSFGMGLLSTAAGAVLVGLLLAAGLGRPRGRAGSSEAGAGIE
jgi:uncharacterized membrane protein YfhO